MAALRHILPAMITIFFRYDDYSQCSSWGVDRGLINIFRARGLCCTFAVVPAVTAAYPDVYGDDRELHLAGERAGFLRKAVADEVVDLALHGWSHRPQASSPTSNPSEFAGLPLDQQIEILRRGKAFLSAVVGAVPQVFVPPWNTYDENTLSAMEVVGIPTISAHLYSPPPGCAGGRLTFAPITVELDRLREAVIEGRSVESDDLVVGVMLHPYDFSESGDARARTSLTEFERELAWLVEQPNVQVVPISKLRNSWLSMDSGRFVANRPSRLENIFPPFMPKRFDETGYLVALAAKEVKRKAVLKVFFWYLGVFLLFFIGGWVAGEGGASSSRKELFFLITSLFAVTVAIAVRSLVNRGIYFKAATLLTVLAGCAVGLIAALCG